MIGKQATVVLIGWAALAATTYGWSSYLEHTKEVKLEELKSKDHQSVLQSLLEI